MKAYAIYTIGDLTYLEWGSKIMRREINVGVDVWDYKPVSLDKLTKELESDKQYIIL